MVMGQMSKQHRRVYSLHPIKLARSVFARKYLSHLLPALKKMFEENTISSSNKNVDEDYSNSKLEKLVGYQVNMAMVFSASTYQFAWSRALKQQLQTRHVLIYGEGLLPRHHVPKPLNFLPNPSVSASKMKRYSNHNMSNKVRPHFLKRNLAMNGKTKKSKEAEIIEKKLTSLRRLLPGGNEMGEENELLAEVGSYISCLQLQVNILRCLVETDQLIN
ncbi:PREDICTED: uncharacterized protein At4g30180 [Prunus mume]|uniref:Uncharacterized protein At4g30180 n=1 Tax=Prunus mume TaxID=102107 RepID=A0ABM0NEW2_PRUMU|nr:PREDICTED: uncharacterized protein At4g30180 [Prunus mume]